MLQDTATRMAIYGLTNVRETKQYGHTYVDVENIFTGYVDPAEIVAVELVEVRNDTRLKGYRQIRIALSSGEWVWDQVWNNMEKTRARLAYIHGETVEARKTRNLTPSTAGPDIPLPPPLVATKRITKARVENEDWGDQHYTVYTANHDRWSHSEITWSEHGLPRFQVGEEIQVVLIRRPHQ